MIPAHQTENEALFVISQDTIVTAHIGEGVVLTDKLSKISIALFPEEVDGLIDALQSAKEFIGRKL